MCEPVTIGALTLTATQTAMAGLMIATAAASVYASNKQGKAQAQLIGRQNQVQADQIADAAGQQLTERSRAARRERAMMRASGAEAGINLGSGSFLAALSTSALNQTNDAGTILQNERNQQAARQANANSLQNQNRANTAYGWGAAAQIIGAGVGGYSAGQRAGSAGSQSALQTG